MRLSPSRVHLAVVVQLAVLAVAERASANAPEFVAALDGRAADEWQAECATATTTGTPCDTTICGANITIEAGGSPTQRNLEINGHTYNLHDVTTERIDLAAAALLNAICASGPGDPFVATAGAFGIQRLQIEAFMARARSTRGRGGIEIVTLPVSAISVGAEYERGSDSSNAFIVPVSYARNLSDTLFMSVSGSFLYGLRAGADPTPATGGSVPALRQWGFDLTPSVGMEKRAGRATYAVGGYLPVAYSKTTLEDSDVGFSAYAVGAGGIGTLTAPAGNTTLNAGLALAGRKTGGAFSVPGTALVRAVHPLSLLIDGYGSLSYGHDPVGSKAGLFAVAAGVGFGKYQLGARGFLSPGYSAVLIGFSFHQELEGSFAIERPPEDGSAEKPAGTP
ncbi:MAG: hypothetical protein IPM35_23405 [Myxococcales bacterium]|nr:hypothetical protein [Myxococcales bacterium]